MYALITGSSSGIGKAMAVECARRGINLVLVALPASGLESVAGELRDRYQVDVLYYSIDLTQENAVNRVYDWCVEQEIPVNILINNAGIGFAGAFEKAASDFNTGIVRLNTEAMVSLTHIMLPLLQKQPAAYILNMSSMACLHPMPYKTLYAASKVFVYYFSQGLRQELKSSNVSVSVICPGPVITNEGVAERIKKQGAWVRLSVMSAEEVAGMAIKGLLARKHLIVPGRLNRIYARVVKLFSGRLLRSFYAWRLQDT